MSARVRRIQRAYPYHFSKTVSAGATRPNGTETVVQEMPFDGQTEYITIIWPDSDSGFGINLKRESGERLYPRDPKTEFESSPIAFGETFPLRTEIKKGERLVAEYENHLSQPLTVTFKLGIEELEVPDGR